MTPLLMNIWIQHNIINKHLLFAIMSSWKAFKVIGQRGEDRYVQLQIIKTPTKQYLFELREFYKEKSTEVNVSFTMSEALWLLEFITSDNKIGKIIKNKRSITVEKDISGGLEIYVYNYFTRTFRYITLYEEELKSFMVDKDLIKNIIDEIITLNKIEMNMHLYTIVTK
jgi:hypothetical protein